MGGRQLAGVPALRMDKQALEAKASRWCQTLVRIPREWYEVMADFMEKYQAEAFSCLGGLASLEVLGDPHLREEYNRILSASS